MSPCPTIHVHVSKSFFFGHESHQAGMFLIQKLERVCRPSALLTKVEFLNNFLASLVCWCVCVWCNCKSCTRYGDMWNIECFPAAAGPCPFGTMELETKRLEIRTLLLLTKPVFLTKLRLKQGARSTSLQVLQGNGWGTLTDLEPTQFWSESKMAISDGK